MEAPIRKFYKNKKIFLTGGTGFLGTILVEKILRSFPDISEILMLVRPKDEISIEQRKRTYFDNPVFDRLKEECGINSDKVKWLEGDIRRVNLGLSPENIKLIQEESNAIIHGASLLSFLRPLKGYVEEILRATHDLLEIAQGCSKLEAFVYISTAYSQKTHKRLHTTEAILQSPIAPLELLKLSEALNASELEGQIGTLCGDWYNHYMYMKNTTENLLKEYEGRLPIAIFRPGKVGPTYVEPTPYYIGNNLTLMGIFMEAHRGLVAFANPIVNADFVPADMTMNGLLAVLRRTAQDKSRKLLIYNYTTESHPCTINDSFRYYSSGIPDYESVLVPHRYKLMGMTDVKPRSIEEKMRKDLKFFYKVFNTMAMGMIINWTADNNNIDSLWDQLGNLDKALIPFDVRQCDWVKYFSNMAANQYGVKIPKFDDLEADPKKREELKKNCFYKALSNY